MNERTIKDEKDRQKNDQKNCLVVSLSSEKIKTQIKNDQKSCDQLFRLNFPKNSQNLCQLEKMPNSAEEILLFNKKKQVKSRHKKVNSLDFFEDGKNNQLHRRFSIEKNPEIDKFRNKKVGIKIEKHFKSTNLLKNRENNFFSISDKKKLNFNDLEIEECKNKKNIEIRNSLNQNINPIQRESRHIKHQSLFPETIEKIQKILKGNHKNSVCLNEVNSKHFSNHKRINSLNSDMLLEKYQKIIPLSVCNKKNSRKIDFEVQDELLKNRQQTYQTGRNSTHKIALEKIPESILNYKKQITRKKNTSVKILEVGKNGTRKILIPASFNGIQDLLNFKQNSTKNVLKNQKLAENVLFQQEVIHINPVKVNFFREEKSKNKLLIDKINSHVNICKNETSIDKKTWIPIELAPYKLSNFGSIKRKSSKEKLKNHVKKIHPSIFDQFSNTKSCTEILDQLKYEKVISQLKKNIKNIAFKAKDSKELSKLKELVLNAKKSNNSFPEGDLQFYDIIKVIGEGSFGKVFLGVQKLTNRLVAIKRLNKSNCKNETARKKIICEMNIQQKLNRHPNIVKLLEVVENHDFIYFVMEYATNGDLLEHMKKKKRLKENEAQKLFSEIALGVQYIHQNGIIHRDLKLDNILIDDDFVCKICDFGVGRYMKTNEIINEQCGTPAYLAPEIILEKGYKGFSSDIWSLGILLFYMLFGQMPFKAMTIEKLNVLIKEGKFIYPSNIPVSQVCYHLISKMIVINPQDRLTIDEIILHPWINTINLEKITIKGNQKQGSSKYERVSDDQHFVINQNAVKFVVELGFDKDSLKKSLNENVMNHATACYYTIVKDFV